MWIGLLYYFNVVQVPGLADAAADKGGPGGAGIGKYIAPRALWWFRWAAVATWITGAWYLGSGYGDANGFVQAFTLQPGFRTLGVGVWLGTIMLFNVWVFIWPNQKKILGIVQATDDQKAKARKTALYASRTNFILSVPMLMCMGGQMHGLPLVLN
ncbi:MAG: urate hydroxylase PuuD [Gammaproteobacteria bacterium]